jgi:GTP-binding protein EngB required for normal cell division
MSDPTPEHFNEPQRSRILACVSTMDKLLVSVEEILAASSSEAFPKYKNPLTPVQVRTTRDYIKRLRQQITHVLKDVEISLPPAKFDSTHSIRVSLQFVEIAIEELAPGRLKGYGEPPPTLLRRLSGGLQEMKGIVRQIDSYLIQQPNSDLSARLNRLADTGAVAKLLADLAAIIDRYGFIEFRAPLSRLVQKMEEPAYEIAFFGRVSSGKSSLLNRIIGADLLPTGVTPVTSVPTRIRNRPKPSLSVWTASGQLERYGIERLADFVTEERNPGNDKRVTRVVAEVPLAILPEEVVLVDTPGLGSLALEGAAETLAYLPNCDLGVVLVDAASNLHTDDIATLDALRSASVPCVLVLSKADLVGPRDMERLVEYTRKQVERELGTPIDVAPLSSRPEFSHLLKKWIDAQIAPRIANARHLAEESNARKANALGQRILHSLKMTLKATALDEPVKPPADLRDAETLLREAATLVERISSECFRLTRQIRDAAEQAVGVLADNAISIWQTNESTVNLNSDWMQKAIHSIAQNEAEGLAHVIQDTARELSEALDAAARATSTGERAEGFSLENLVKELPVPDFPGCLIDLHKPRLLALSVGLARHSVKSNIESACGVSLAKWFDSYGRALELWFRNILINLEREFNSNADIYRAQMQRLAGTGAKSAPDQTILLQDVSTLEQHLGLSDVLDHRESPAMV